MTTMISIQQAYIDRLTAYTGTGVYLRRVRKGALHAAHAKLEALGYDRASRLQIMRDADDMVALERDA
jgi:hypothetical protein